MQRRDTWLGLMLDCLSLSPEVAAARAQQRPIVALESTIITHGMPYPNNLRLARELEDWARSAGITPATIAIGEGSIKVGLADKELEYLARAQETRKLSRADLAHCLQSGAWGSTTVAATMLCAHLAGIEVFATGGIGGVHLGAEHSFDISADLTELARTPVTVIAAGAKAILDIPKTLEMLETLGVPVMVYGSDDFPAFWSRQSGCTAPMRVDSPVAIAKMHKRQAALGCGGQLVANPIPTEDEISFATIQPWIEAAQQQARYAGISGKALTPYLLQRIVKASSGASLKANTALVRNNLRLAAEVARELAT